jgi:hypothetical protein
LVTAAADLGDDIATALLVNTTLANLKTFTKWVGYGKKALEMYMKYSSVMASEDIAYNQADVDNTIVEGMGAELLRQITALDHLERSTAEEISYTEEMYPTWYYFFSPLLGTSTSRALIEQHIEDNDLLEFDEVMRSANTYVAHGFVVVYFPIQIWTAAVPQTEVRMKIEFSTGVTLLTIFSKIKSLDLTNPIDIWKAFSDEKSNTISFNVTIQSRPDKDSDWMDTHSSNPNFESTDPALLYNIAHGHCDRSSNEVIEFINCMKNTIGPYAPVTNNCQVHSKILIHYLAQGSLPNWFNARCVAQVKKALFSELSLDSLTGGAAWIVPALGYPFGPGQSSITALNTSYQDALNAIQAHGTSHLDTIISQLPEPVHHVQIYDQDYYDRINQRAVDDGIFDNVDEGLYVG